MTTIDGNFINKYTEYAGCRTHTNKRYHIYSGYALLSQAILNTLRLDMVYGTYRPNLWIILVGESTLTKKTTSMYLAYDVGKKVGFQNFLPTDFTPEGLVDYMSSTPQGYMWIDEMGGLLKIFGRDYMSSAKELMMKLYSGKDVHRKLSNEEYHVMDPALGLIGTTTPKTMEHSMSTDDMFSGFGARFLHIYHDEKYEWHPAKNMTDEIMKKEQRLIDTLKRIKIKFQQEKKAVMGDDAMELFNEWDKQTMGELKNDGHRRELASLYGRIRDYILKLSMLNEVAENWDNMSIQDDKIEISKESMQEAIDRMDNYVDNIRARVIRTLYDGKDMYVYDKIKDEEPIVRSRLLRLTHLSSSKLSKKLSNLIDAELVEETTKQTKTKPKTVYRTTIISLSDDMSSDTDSGDDDT